MGARQEGRARPLLASRRGAPYMLQRHGLEEAPSKLRQKEEKMSVPYDRKGKRSAALAFGGLGAVIGAALGALIAGPGSGFMGAIPGAIGAALGGALFGLWFDRNA
jgi:hypothetical protein